MNDEVEYMSSSEGRARAISSAVIPFDPFNALIKEPFAEAIKEKQRRRMFLHYSSGFSVMRDYF